MSEYVSQIEAKKVGISDAGRSTQLSGMLVRLPLPSGPGIKKPSNVSAIIRKHHRAPNLPPDQHRRQQDSNSNQQRGRLRQMSLP